MSARSYTLALGLLASLATVQAMAQQTPALNTLLEQGRYWQARGDFKRAAEVWEKLLVANPDNPDALYGLARAALHDENFGKANQYMGRLRDTAPKNALVPLLEQEIYLAQPGPKAELDKARSLTVAQEMDQAIAQYDKVLQGRKPLGNLAREYYNYLGYSTNGLPRAIQGLEDVLRTSPSNLTNQLALAKHLIRTEDRRGDGLQMLQRLSTQPAVASEATEALRTALTWIGPAPDEYRSAFERYLAANPGDDEIRQLLATGNANRTTAAAASHTGATPPRQDPALTRGFAALEAGQLADAETTFQSILQRKPRDADALGGMGLVRLQQKNFTQAEQFLRDAAAQKSTWKKNLTLVQYWKLVDAASQARSNGQFAQARSLAGQAIKIDGKRAAAHNIVAGTFTDEGYPDKSEQAYRKALKGDPRDTEALQGLANTLAQMGKIDDAAALLNRLATNRRLGPGEINKLRAAIATGRAKAAQQRGDQAGAQLALEQALRDDPNNPWIRLDLARLYLKRGARTEARDLVDSLVRAQPGMTDALYSSALLSADMNDWPAAYAALQRIRPDERSAEINTLTRRAGILVKADEASKLARNGNFTEARTLLARLEPEAINDLALAGPIASAYVDAGDTARGLSLMRNQLENSGNSTDAILSYAGLLLRTGQDPQASAMMRELQARSLTPDQQSLYNNLQFAHTVRQADLLREQGNLAQAYDTLMPALSQRPDDPAALAALARIYSASGDDKQALAYYKRLLQNDPDNANLQLAAAMSAAKTGDKTYADTALERALTLAPRNPEVLANAARIYRSQGKSGKALDLMTEAVDAENNRVAMTTPTTPVPHRQEPAPAPALTQNQTMQRPMTQPRIGNETALAPMAAPRTGTERLQAQPPSDTVQFQAPAISDTAQRPESLQPRATQGQHQAPSQANTGRIQESVRTVAPQPLVVAGPDNITFGPALASRQQNPAPPLQTGASNRLDNLNQELAELRDLRNPEVTLATTARSNNGEEGLSKLDDRQASLQVRLPVQEGKLVVEATAVQIKAGDVGNDYSSRERFGGGAVAVYDSVVTNNRIGDPLALNNAAPAGQQRDSGVGVSVAYEYQGLRVDAGTTPLGFQETNFIGGIKYDGTFNEQDRTWYSVDLSRRPVTDSVASFAGVTDNYSGLSWGGVTATGVQLQAGQDSNQFGYYAYGGWHALRGENVANNTRANIGAGMYWHLVRNSNTQLTAGLNLGATFYDKNQRFFTYGHGGYFSPQSMYSISIPFTWAQRSGRLSYKLQGSIGVERFKEDSADYFPTSPLLQAQALAATQYARSMGYTGATSVYSGQTKTGFSYNLQGAAEYRLSDHLILGSHLGLNNAKDYRQWGGGLYLRYYFYPTSRDLDLPVKPYRGPYAN